MKPTVILHIGSGKAGSTTIQKTLSAIRDRLLEDGILVPDQNGKNVDPFDYLAMFSNQRGPRDGPALLKNVTDQMEEHAPRVVIISGEHLWGHLPSAEGAKAALAPYCDEIRVVLYLREPRAYYVSLNQQQLKATDKLLDPATWRANYRRNVEHWRAIYGDKLEVIPFQPSAFPNGLVEDFLLRATGRDIDLSTGAAPERENVSECAEVTWITQTYFRYCHPGEPREFRPDATLARGELQNIATQEGLGNKAVLLPQVEKANLWNHRDDLLWLLEAEGVQFDAIDYDALRAMDPAVLPEGLTELDDVVDLDRGQAKEIAMKTIRHLVRRLRQGDRARKSLEQARKDRKAADKKVDWLRAERTKLEAERDVLRAEVARAKSELERVEADRKQARAQLAAAQADISARRSRLAAGLDRLDYEARRVLAGLPLPSASVRERLRASAERRYRKSYGQSGSD